MEMEKKEIQLIKKLQNTQQDQKAAYIRFKEVLKKKQPNARKNP